MITGLREFRKTLSKYTSLIKRGQIIIVTDRNLPIAAFISPDKLRELAKKAEDNFIISQLNEAQVDKNKEFLERKNLLVKEIYIYLEEAKKGKGRVPNHVVNQLQIILDALNNLTSKEGTLDDQRMVYALEKKSRSPISRVIDNDYYYIHDEFVKKLNEEIKNLITKATAKENNTNFPSELSSYVNIYI